MAISNVFSKRDKPLPDTFVYDKLPNKLRVQIVHLMNDTIGNIRRGIDLQRDISMYARIRQSVCEEHGKFSLADDRDTVEDTLRCVAEGTDVSLVLDVVEQFGRTLLILPRMLQRGHFEYNGRDAGEALDDLNHRFRENGVGYEFNEGTSTLIRVDSLLTHRELIQPTLALLTAQRFKTANDEFVSALDDYRHGRYGDALTKCGSAYESVMKVICDGKRWPYPSKANAGQLVRAIIAGTGLDPCYEQMLIPPATIRNRLSTAHGGGDVARKTEEHQFKFALHQTAAAIQFLAEETA